MKISNEVFHSPFNWKIICEMTSMQKVEKVHRSRLSMVMSVSHGARRVNGSAREREEPCSRAAQRRGGSGEGVWAPRPLPPRVCPASVLLALLTCFRPLQSACRSPGSLIMVLEGVVNNTPMDPVKEKVGNSGEMKARSAYVLSCHRSRENASSGTHTNGRFDFFLK